MHVVVFDGLTYQGKLMNLMDIMSDKIFKKYIKKIRFIISEFAYKNFINRSNDLFLAKFLEHQSQIFDDQQREFFAAIQILRPLCECFYSYGKYFKTSDILLKLRFFP